MELEDHRKANDHAENTALVQHGAGLQAPRKIKIPLTSIERNHPDRSNELLIVSVNV